MSVNKVATLLEFGSYEEKGEVVMGSAAGVGVQNKKVYITNISG